MITVACSEIILSFAKPPLTSVLFWLLLSVCIGAFLYTIILARIEAREVITRYQDWHRKLMELVDIDDFDNDGHLSEWFSESEWSQIFSELKATPKGSRSLKNATARVIPENSRMQR